MLIRTLFLLLISLPIYAIEDGKVDDVEIARNLGKAIRDDMAANYMCQDYLGGLGRYRVAKLTATLTLARVTGDRNKAVLSIDKIENVFKEEYVTAKEAFKKNFDKRNLTWVDRMGVCQDMTAESHDKIQVLKAKLGLL